MKKHIGWKKKMMIIHKNEKIIEEKMGEKILLYLKDTGEFFILNEDDAFLWQIFNKHKYISSLMVYIYQRENQGETGFVKKAEKILNTLIKLGMIRIVDETTTNV